MRWWCSAVEVPWSWAPRPYLGVWLLCLGLALWYGLAWGAHRRAGSEPTDRDASYMRRFAGGVVALWIASDWPVGALAGGYLMSLHMTQYLLYTLAAAPLLMLGTPEWLADAVLDRLHLQKVWSVLSRPLVAVIVSNVILVSTHSPFAVDRFRSTQLGSFAMDMIWLLSGLVLWGPVINPVRSGRIASDPLRIVYLFVAAAVLPMIPGGFITFSSNPLFATYELAPRVGMTALHDQQLAGVLMKIGNVPVIWAAMGVIWFRWYEKEHGTPGRPAVRIAGSSQRGVRDDSAEPGAGTDVVDLRDTTSGTKSGGPVA
jgi:putative membrane protein